MNLTPGGARCNLCVSEPPLEDLMKPSAVIILLLVACLSAAGCGSRNETADAGAFDGGFTGDVGGIPPVVNCTDQGGRIGEMCEVPAGPFFMGCNEVVDNQCEPSEKPSLRVELSGFLIDRYEVTNDEYRACVTAGGCAVPHIGDLCDYTKSGWDGHPVNCVDYNQAAAYCAWAGKRLPTEAQWEKAARGVDGQKYPWGNSPEPSCDYAVVFEEGACGTRETMPVGSRPKGASPYGVMDMAGNVWEWVADWFDENYYRSSPDDDPQGPATGTNRVLRGGSWGMSYINFLRCSARWGKEPAADFGTIGFRCVK